MPKLPEVKRFISSTGVRIYRIPCQVFSYLTARVYLLLGAGQPTLVDTGSGRGDSTRHILAGLKTVRADFGEAARLTDVKRVLITHAHIDHIGGLSELIRKTDAEVMIHPLECRQVAACEEHAAIANRHLERFFKQAGLDPQRSAELLAGNRQNLDSLHSVPVGRLISDGEQIDGMRFVHTPGHSPGMLCMVVGDVLLCADHILARTVPQQWPESLNAYAGLGHYFDSLEKIRRMGGFDLALAGHEPVMHNVYKRIDALRESNQRRLDRLVEILGDNDHPMTISEMAVRMYAPPRGTRTLLALCDVGARIEYLYQQGRLAIANFHEIDSRQDVAYRYFLSGQ